MLAEMDAAVEGARIDTLWAHYVAVVDQARPADYELCYPQSLLESLARRVVAGCRALGLRDFREPPASGRADRDIPTLIGQAWERFLDDADAYADWETARLAEPWSMPGTS